jgi:hypothetical protein
MMAAMSLTGPGPRAGIPRKRSSAPQSPDRPVAQPKRRPHKGGARLNNNRPSSGRPPGASADPDPSEPAPSRSSSREGVPTRTKSQRVGDCVRFHRGRFAHAKDPAAPLLAISLVCPPVTTCSLHFSAVTRVTASTTAGLTLRRSAGLRRSSPCGEPWGQDAKGRAGTPPGPASPVRSACRPGPD